MSALCQKRTYAVQQIPTYLITLSARPSNGIGTVRLRKADAALFDHLVGERD